MKKLRTAWLWLVDVSIGAPLLCLLALTHLCEGCIAGLEALRDWLSDYE